MALHTSVADIIDMLRKIKPQLNNGNKYWRQ